MEQMNDWVKELITTAIGIKNSKDESLAAVVCHKCTGPEWTCLGVSGS